MAVEAPAPLRPAALHLAWAQVAARNIAPFCGILFLGWSAPGVLVLYFADTLLSLTVIFAGVLSRFAPPVRNDGWAARINGEVGLVGGGVFLAIAFAVPLGVPLVFIIGDDVSWRELLDDGQLRGGLAWQAIAALWSYVGLWRALHHATIEELQLKRRFSLVFLRWLALLFVAMTGIGLFLGGHGAVVFVAIYIALSIWSEIAPDRFLRSMPGGTEDAERAPVLPERRRARRFKRRK